MGWPCGTAYAPPASGGQYQHPVFLIQPEKDVSVVPVYALAQELQKDGKPYKFTIYPPFGTDAQNGHCSGGADRIWGRDAVNFLNQVSWLALAIADAGMRGHHWPNTRTAR
jgi:hypothetical protein